MVAILGCATAGCGAGSSSSAVSPATGGPRLTGSITVLAAASLTDAFSDAGASLERAHPGFRVTLSFAGSQQLVAEVMEGAPADVIATADGASMDELDGRGLVESRRAMARNRLEIAVTPGNPRRIRGLRDLGRGGLTVVLADPAVPAGRAAREALRRAHATVMPSSLELDVKSTIRRVETGDADAAIVYVTDVLAAGQRVQGVPIPDDENVTTTYSIAIVRAAGNREASSAFVDEVVSGAVQRCLQRLGFGAP